MNNTIVSNVTTTFSLLTTLPTTSPTTLSSLLTTLATIPTTLTTTLTTIPTTSFSKTKRPRKTRTTSMPTNSTVTTAHIPTEELTEEEEAEPTLLPETSPQQSDTTYEKQSPGTKSIPLKIKYLITIIAISFVLF